MSPEGPPPAGLAAIRCQIAAEIARVHVESYGERALNLRVAFDRDLVAVMMDIEFTPAERTLVGAGREDAVAAARESYQEAIGEVFIAIVERATGRRVEGFASRAMIAEPNPCSVEVFRLQA